MTARRSDERERRAFAGSSSVAVIGIGRIGTALVARLVAGGHDVTALDVRPDRRRTAEQLGARWATDVAAATESADFVFTVLPGSPELGELVLKSRNLLPHLRPSAIWIDLTSASYAVSRECAAHAAEQGIAHLDAPLGGGVDAVRKGDATLYVGGDPAVLEIALPVLGSFTSAVHHAGRHGAGHLTKLLINLLWFGQVGLVTEALLLAQRLDVAPERLSALLTGSAADSVFVTEHLPALLRGDYLADFGLDRCVEELESVEHAAAAAALPHTVTSAIADLHRAALRRYGPVDGELLAAAWLEEQAGSRLAGRLPRTPDRATGVAPR